jgi:hypothetical protein
MYKAELLKKLETIPEDEPLFLLRGRDQIGVPLVVQWAIHAEAKGVNQPKLRDAMDIADAMDRYPIKKLPD